jgi:putative acetyltransferase
MRTIHIRAYEPEDLDSIIEILDCPNVIAGMLFLPYQSAEQRRGHLARHMPGTYRLVAVVDGKVVGMVSLQLEEALRRRHCGSIRLAVHDAHQRRGVGTALLTALTDLTDNWLGLHRVELRVQVDHAPAIHLYEKFGFTIEGTARDALLRDGAYVDIYSMARLKPREMPGQNEGDRGVGSGRR